jgi:cytochrome c oxidase subunit 3
VSLHAMESHGASGHGGDHHGHGQKVSVQFEDLDQQNESYIVGMWSFLVTEIMFFGVLFLIYTLYRSYNFSTYLEAHHFLSVPMGTINTFVLLTSSLSAALGVYWAQHGKRILVILALAFTCLCACGFMVVKFFEYTAKIHEGIYPDQNFNYAKALTIYHTEHAKAGGDHAENPRANIAWKLLEEARKGPEAEFVEKPASGLDSRIATPEAGTIAVPVRSANWAKFDVEAGKAKMFFSIYFSMTGLHGIHVVIGIICMVTLMLLYGTKHPAVDDYMPMEMVGLYWHFVDIVWIFLFPLMYLIS